MAGIQRDKYPAEDLPFDFDFTAWALLASDPLLSATVASTPAGLSVSAAGIDVTGKKVQVRISGGASGTTYLLTCRAHTTAGYEVDGEGELLVR